MTSHVDPDIFSVKGMVRQSYFRLVAVQIEFSNTHLPTASGIA